MNSWESSNQHEEMMPEELKEAIESYVFKTNGFCVIACYKNDEDGKPSIAIMKKDKGLSPEGIEEAQNKNYIMKEDEGALFHIDNQSADYTQLVNEIVGKHLPKLVVVANRT